MGALGKQLQAAGKPPAPDQRAELGRLQKLLTQASRWSAGLAAPADVFTAVARYL